ncbi:MAG: hypothetical protein ACH350_07195 [Parachlamydiaceae bacterium]
MLQMVAVEAMVVIQEVVVEMVVMAETVVLVMGETEEVAGMVGMEEMVGIAIMDVEEMEEMVGMLIGRQKMTFLLFIESDKRYKYNSKTLNHVDFRITKTTNINPMMLFSDRVAVLLGWKR